MSCAAEDGSWKTGRLTLPRPQGSCAFLQPAGGVPVDQLENELSVLFMIRT